MAGGKESESRTLEARGPLFLDLAHFSMPVDSYPTFFLVYRHLLRPALRFCFFFVADFSDSCRFATFCYRPWTRSTPTRGCRRSTTGRRFGASENRETKRVRLLV